MLLLLACAPPDPVPASGFSAELDSDVGTMVKVRWSQDGAADSWVSFTFDGETHESPVESREAGSHEAWLLGVPGATEVTWQVWTQVEDVGFQGDEQVVTTDPVPEDFPGIEVPIWEPDLAHEAGWVFGSVDINGGDAYTGPFWLFIADRQGRVVWWRNLEWDMSMFPRVSDGHIAWDQRSFFDTTGESSIIRRQTLDESWEQEIPAPGLGWTWDETDDGAVVYDKTIGQSDLQLAQVDAQGEHSILWDCTAWLEPLLDDPEACFTNATNYDAERDTVLWSTYWGDFVVEVDRSSGEVLWYAGGGLEGGLAFDPPEAAFDLQHYPNWTAAGTLLVSTHIDGVEGEQRAREFSLSDTTLTEVWSYGEGVTDVWAKYSGEAVRLDNGNTVQNYGTGGEIREVTSAGEVAWSFQFGDTYTIGHTDLITDLYALNVGE